MKGWGLVFGWCGCECDGLVSNTLSLSMSATSTHPSMVSHSPVCFKAIALSITTLVLVGFLQWSHISTKMGWTKGWVGVMTFPPSTKARLSIRKKRERNPIASNETRDCGLLSHFFEGFLFCVEVKQIPETR